MNWMDSVCVRKIGKERQQDGGDLEFPMCQPHVGGFNLNRGPQAVFPRGCAFSWPFYNKLSSDAVERDLYEGQ